MVITGSGAIAPSGLSAAAVVDTVFAGHSAVDVLAGSAYDELPVRIGAQIRHFSPLEFLPKPLIRRLEPVQQWAIAAANQAMTAAGLWDGKQLTASPERIGIIVATGSGPITAMQAATRALDTQGPRAVPLTLSAFGSPDSVGAVLTEQYRAFGPSYAISATCASSTVALGQGLRYIRHGYLDHVLVIGMEDCLGPVNLASNSNMRALAAGYEDDPQAASRPFDQDRSGFVMGHGAGALVLSATAQGHVINNDADASHARVEIAGYGESSDAYHATAPHPEGRGAGAAMTAALRDADIDPRTVGAIYAHATGTRAGDSAELAALHTVFGEYGRTIPLTATKSATGHLLGASGLLAVICAINTVTTGRVPPTLNLDRPEFPDWDYVTGSARATDAKTALVNSFGFGGHNAALIVRRAP